MTLKKLLAQIATFTFPKSPRLNMPIRADLIVALMNEHIAGRALIRSQARYYTTEEARDFYRASNTVEDLVRGDQLPAKL